MSETCFDAVLCRKLDLSEKEDPDKHHALVLDKETENALFGKCREILRNRKRHLLLKNEKQAAMVYLDVLGYSKKYILSVVGCTIEEFHSTMDSAEKDPRKFMEDISVTKLSAADRRNIITLLKHPPRMAKVNADTWNEKNLSRLLSDRYGVTASMEEARILLDEANGVSYEEETDTVQIIQPARPKENTPDEVPEKETFTEKDELKENNPSGNTIVTEKNPPKKFETESLLTKEKTEELVDYVTKQKNPCVTKLSEAVFSAALIQNLSDYRDEEFYQKHGYSYGFARHIIELLNTKTAENAFSMTSIDSAVKTDYGLREDIEVFLVKHLDEMPKKMAKELKAVKEAFYMERSFTSLGMDCGISVYAMSRRVKAVRSKGVMKAFLNVYPESFVTDPDGSIRFAGKRMELKESDEKILSNTEDLNKESEKGYENMAKSKKSKENTNRDVVLRIDLDESRKVEKQLPFTPAQKEKICKEISGVLYENSMDAGSTPILRLKTFYLVLKGYPASYARELLGINGASTARAYSLHFLDYFKKSGNNLSELLKYIDSFAEKTDSKSRGKKPKIVESPAKEASSRKRKEKEFVIPVKTVEDLKKEKGITVLKAVKNGIRTNDWPLTFVDQTRLALVTILEDIVDMLKKDLLKKKG